MPAYEFECLKCGEQVILIIPISEYETKKIQMSRMREQEVGTTSLLGPGGDLKEELRRNHVYNCGAVWISLSSWAYLG